MTLFTYHGIASDSLHHCVTQQARLTWSKTNQPLLAAPVLKNIIICCRVRSQCCWVSDHFNSAFWEGWG